MYYESKNDKKREKFILTILMIVIIALLCVLIIKLDAPLQIQTEPTNYDVSKLSTKEKQNVEKEIEKQ